MNSSNVYDLVIAGGGPSGVMAAISAGRLGVKTLLIERYGFLGGMNTAALVGPIMTFHAGKVQIVRGVVGEIFEKLKVLGGTPGHLVDPIWGNTTMTPIDAEIYKSLLLEEVERAGVNLLLHSTVLEGELTGNWLNGVTVFNKKGISQYRGDFYVDATGDGDLAAAIGCEFVMGREKDKLTQPMSLMFRMGGVDENRVREAIRANPEDFYLGFPVETFVSLPGLGVSGFFSQVKKGKADGTFPVDRDRILFFGLPKPGEVVINTLRINQVNGTSPEDLTRAETTLRSQVPVLVKFLRDYIPGFEKAYLIETATQVGVRETRHIRGDYCLRAEDILKQCRFPDTIAHASYPIDIHSPDGSGIRIIDPRKENPESYYDIPFRCMLPRGIDNLLVTGRCISAEHEASASARISATCMALGEAAGVAAHEAVQSHCKSFREIQIGNVQKQLVRQGAFLNCRPH